MSEKSSVLMLIYYFYPLVGGAERQCLLQAETLRKAGHKVSVLTTWHRGLKITENIHQVPVSRKIFEIPFPLCRRISLFLTAFLFLWWNRKKYDVVHVHQFNALTICACMAKYLTKKGVVCKQACEKPYSGFDLIEKSCFAGLFMKIIRKLDYLLAISQTTYREAEEHGFHDKLKFLPNGVLIPDWQWNPAARTKILFSGRLHIQKGADLFIRAAALDHSENHEYILLGDGTLRKSLEEQSTPNVTFLGKVLNPEVYLEQDGIIFVLPSRAEGLSNALLEAMVRGIPSIVSNAVSGTSELAGKKIADYPDFAVYENLVLTLPENPQAIHSAIEFLLSQPQRMLSLSRSCRKFIQNHYSIDNICSQLADVYTSTIQINKGNG